MSIYGYARVRTDGQTPDAQVAALKAAGAERIFSEKQSAAKIDLAVLALIAQRRRVALEHRLDTS
jgi:DNA invertase Pin-like site-specific DNA recombinase